MANYTVPHCDRARLSSSGYSSRESLPSPTEPHPHCIHGNPNYCKIASQQLVIESTFSSSIDESKAVYVNEWVESTIDVTTPSGTSPSIATVDHSQDSTCPALSSSPSLQDHPSLPLPLLLPLHSTTEGADSAGESCVMSPSLERCGQLEGACPEEGGSPTLEVLPHSLSMSAPSEWSVFVPFHHSLQNSGRFRRTLRVRRCRRSCDPNRPLVTSCSVAEDNLSLSVVLSLLCLFLNPPCLLLTLPAALLAYMADCNEKEGDLTGFYQKLHVVAALNFVTFFGGLLLPLGGAVTVIVMKCLK